MRPVTDFVGTLTAAGMLGVSDARVRQLIGEGKLPAIKVGRDHLIRRADITRLAADRARQARGDRRLTVPPEVTT
jgi:excisionase family DNA binding protein